MVVFELRNSVPALLPAGWPGGQLAMRIMRSFRFRRGVAHAVNRRVAFSDGANRLLERGAAAAIERLADQKNGVAIAGLGAQQLDGKGKRIENSRAIVAQRNVVDR